MWYDSTACLFLSLSHQRSTAIAVSGQAPLLGRPDAEADEGGETSEYHPKQPTDGYNRSPRETYRMIHILPCGARPFGREGGGGCTTEYVLRVSEFQTRVSRQSQPNFQFPIFHRDEKAKKVAGERDRSKQKFSFDRKKRKQEGHAYYRGDISVAFSSR